MVIKIDIDKTNDLKKSQQDENDEDSLTNNMHSFLKNLKLTIKRLHIRFEDDYFSTQSPFSLGLAVDQLDLETSDTEWTFDSLL